MARRFIASVALLFFYSTAHGYPDGATRFDYRYRKTDVRVKKSRGNPGVVHATLCAAMLIADQEQLFHYSALGLTFPDRAPTRTTRTLFNRLAAKMVQRVLRLDELDLAAILTPNERERIGSKEIARVQRVLGELQRRRPKDFSRAVEQQKTGQGSSTAELLDLVVARADELPEKAATSEAFTPADREAMARAASIEACAGEAIRRQVPRAMARAGTIDARRLPQQMPSFTVGTGKELVGSVGQRAVVQQVLSTMGRLRSGRAQLAYLARQVSNLAGSEDRKDRDDGKELGRLLTRYIDEVWGKKAATDWLAQVLNRHPPLKPYELPEAWLATPTAPGSWGAQYGARSHRRSRWGNDRTVEGAFSKLARLLDPGRRRAALDGMVTVSDHGTQGAVYARSYELVDWSGVHTSAGSPSSSYKPALVHGASVREGSVFYLLGFALQERGGTSLNLMLADLLARRAYGSQAEPLAQIARRAYDPELIGVRSGFQDAIASRIRRPESGGPLELGDSVGPNYVLQAGLMRLTSVAEAYEFLRSDTEYALLLLQHLQSPIEPRAAQP